jgi:hypothetical protein
MRRLFAPLTAVLATLASAFALLVVVNPPAHAMESLLVCTRWGSDGYETPNRDGTSTYHVNAVCRVTTTIFIGAPEEPGGGKDPGTGGSGHSGPMDEGSKAYCEYVARELNQLRAALSAARAHIGQARADAARLNAKAGVDYAAVERYRGELQQAQAEYDDAAATYDSQNDTTVDVDVKNGVTVHRQIGFNPFLPGGQALVRAQQGLSSAQRSYSQAFDQWGQRSGPAARQAQSLLDYYEGVLANGPGETEVLQRELAEHCQ